MARQRRLLMATHHGMQWLGGGTPPGDGRATAVVNGTTPQPATVGRVDPAPTISYVFALGLTLLRYFISDQ